MIDVHLKKLRRRDEISAQEERVVRDLVSETVRVASDKVITRAGQPLNHSMFLIEGWAARAKDLANGERQFAELHVPGDFTDLHGFILKKLDHDVVSISPCLLAIVPHERLRHMTEQHAHLTRVYWFSTSLDASIHREWTLSLGRRPALARMAHLFCELFVRLEIVGLTNGNSYEFPLTQSELGECLGLTSVHVNRTLQELRRMGLIEVQDRRVDILDAGALKNVGGFDPGYLYLEKEAR
jgi:CRP-like cAMP-binding protein